MRAGVGGEHLPDDGELIGACEDIGEDEGEPELAHILLRLAEKEQVAGVHPFSLFTPPPCQYDTPRAPCTNARRR